MVSSMIFFACLAVAAYFVFNNIVKIRRNINLGKTFETTGNQGERFKKMMFIAFGQQKMFDRPLVALLHLFVYLGFLIVNIEMLEIIIDGLFGTHRVLLKFLGNSYHFMVNIFEFFAITIIIACVIFYVRRNVLKIKRFWFSEMTTAPRTDANIILITEILLMSAFLWMNAADLSLQAKGLGHYTQTGSFLISSHLVPLIDHLSAGSLIFIERGAWWFHILGVLAFANYLPYSKHLHIILAFPNTYFSNLLPAGQFKNMPEVTKEVKLMLNLPLTEAENAAAPAGRFGAKDVPDLTWKQLMEAYTCTECGRCSSVCPAKTTGKKLSPRKIMMDTRDRMEEIGANIDKNGSFQDDGKTLYGNYISQEELLACTTCNACVDACPVNIDPLSIIMDLRRFMIMEESKAPASWNNMFSNLENNMAPWKFAPTERFNWAKKEEK
jgi:heterodisulfide reductase subunit C